MRSYASIPEIMGAIQESFDPAKSGSDNHVIQFDFTGEGGGHYWLKVADGRCLYGAGEAPESPEVTIACTVEDWLSIINRTLTPVSAFTRGRLKVKGNAAVALKLQKWFPVPSET